MTSDEDGGPVGEVIEFRQNGSYVAYDRSCRPLQAIAFHVHQGDIYVTSTIAGKGPVAVIFHSSDQRNRLTFTSPRTKNNAAYERVPKNQCVGQG